MLPAPPLTDPDERISRIRFFTRKLRSRNSILMDDLRRRQWVSSEHGSEARPRQIAVPPSPPEPFLPYPDELVMIPSDPIAVSGDAVVGAVPPDHPRQASVLFPKRAVQISPAPLGHGSKRSGITVFCRYLPHDVLTPPRPSPHVGKAKEVESRAHGRRMTPVGAFEPEVYEACLGRMELKAIPAEPLAQHVQQSLAGRVVLKGNHRIIGISNQQASAMEPRSHRALEPFVQHMVQVDVREQWGDHAALGRSDSRPAQDTLFKHPRLKPFVDHPSDNAVRDSLIEESAQVRVVDGVEVFRDVDVHHPA